jgi:hypothetical protein
MERAGHGWNRSVAGAVVLGALVLVGPPTQASPSFRLHEPTPIQEGIVGWAIGRFRSAGLELPSVEVYFHDGPEGCGGNSGYYVWGRLDLCTGEKDTPYVRGTIVHELSHAWLDLNVSDDTRSEFQRVRRLSTWNDHRQPWGLRGCEQAAEVIAWFLGPGLTPLIPGHPDEAELETGYRVLTGRFPPPAVSVTAA